MRSGALSPEPLHVQSPRMHGRATSLTSAQAQSFRRALLRWYDQHRRHLPWRRDRDPYRIWVSEIMLQQTRVAAVLDHYARFMQRFPTVQSLASAREASVLAAWSGLGYYHRARRMHQAAKVIVRERGGVFPQSAEEWLALPGIGRYTAAAVASIAFDEPVAVVDGNVERVLQRLQGMRARPWNCMAACGSVARSRASRRLQPGHDGTGCDDLYAARSTVFALSGEFAVQDPRSRRTTAPGSSQEQGSALRSGDAPMILCCWCSARRTLR